MCLRCRALVGMIKTRGHPRLCHDSKGPEVVIFRWTLAPLESDDALCAPRLRQPVSPATRCPLAAAYGPDLVGMIKTSGHPRLRYTNGKWPQDLIMIIGSPVLGACWVCWGCWVG